MYTDTMNKIKRTALTIAAIVAMFSMAPSAQADTRPVPTVPPHTSGSVRGTAVYSNCFTIIWRGLPHKVCVYRSKAKRLPNGRTPIDYSRWQQGTGPVVGTPRHI